LEQEPKLSAYSFYWAARADIERRSGHVALAGIFYRRAIELGKSRAERLSYERRLRSMAD
jgi:predicted RNA polymerase sigma factor